MRTRHRRLIWGKLLLGTVKEGRDGEEDDMDMEISFKPGMLEKGEDIVKRKLEKK